jgi:hypothetical protein
LLNVLSGIDVLVGPFSVEYPCQLSVPFEYVVGNYRDALLDGANVDERMFEALAAEDTIRWRFGETKSDQ